MHEFRFIWDLSKSQKNLTKHHIEFQEAQTVFYDPNGLEFYDESHSELEEDRFLFLGLSFKLRLLLVSYCYREKEIRIISARKATKSESKHYKGD